MEERIAVPTPDHGTLEFELAGLGSRFFAHVLDTMLILGLVLAIGCALYLVGFGFMGGAFDGSALSEGAGSVALAVAVMIIFLCYWGYYVFFETLLKGSTPGKRHAKIRVIRDDAFPPGLREAALRNLVRAADSFPPPSYVLGGLVAHLDRRGRRLGDMVAGTLVVRERFDSARSSRLGAAWAERVEKGASRQALTLPGGTVSTEQLDLVEHFLERRDGLPLERRAALTWQVARPLLVLAGEDPAAWERRPARGTECEAFLLGLVRAAAGAGEVGTAGPGPGPAPGGRGSAAAPTRDPARPLF